MVLRKQDLQNGWYQPATQPSTIRRVKLLTGYDADSRSVYSARENLMNILTTSKLPDGDVLADVRAAIGRMDSERDNSWVDTLSADLALHRD